LRIRADDRNPVPALPGGGAAAGRGLFLYGSLSAPFKTVEMTRRKERAALAKRAAGGTDAMADDTGLITLRSAGDVAATARRFREAAGNAGLTIFADIDHAANAAAAGLSLRPTRLLVFGNPRGGTPLMQLEQRAGIDLPFKALIWEDAGGTTWLSWNDPAWLATRHSLGKAAGPVAAEIAAGMEKLAAFATAAD
jgi:uncharacterized protein (DUF302 family)